MLLIEPRLAVHVGVFSASSKSESLASQSGQFAVSCSVERMIFNELDSLEIPLSLKISSEIYIGHLPATFTAHDAPSAHSSDTFQSRHSPLPAGTKDDTRAQA